MSDHERYLAAYRATHGPSEAESARALEIWESVGL